MASNSRIVKAAAVQAEPVWLDLESTVIKTCRLIKEAASNGAQIVSFPEAFVPGYPAWIWVRAMDFETNIRYADNSLSVNSEEMERLKACAAENNIVVCLGYSEREGNSLYIGQCTIDNNGELVMSRRKLKPVHMERTIFGDGNGPSLNNVATTGVGRVGQLSCADHFNPLLVYNTYSQGEEIHCAAWPPVAPHPGGPAPYSMADEGKLAVASFSSVYSMQAQCFTLHSTAVISQPSIEKLGVEQTPLFNQPGGGNARIYGPDGRLLTKDLPPSEEGMVYADLDMSLITKEKGFLDNCGHAGRPELLWLGRNASHQGPVRSA
ncbi:carbon-nitrogen hydrolase [Trichoderma sp. SZMC 28011]